MTYTYKYPRPALTADCIVITKEADSEKYEVGDTVTYTITTINRQKGTIARNLVFDDMITTEGVKLQKASVILMDSDNWKLRMVMIDGVIHFATGDYETLGE